MAYYNDNGREPRKFRFDNNNGSNYSNRNYIQKKKKPQKQKKPQNNMMVQREGKYNIIASLVPAEGRIEKRFLFGRAKKFYSAQLTVRPVGGDVKSICCTINSTITYKLRPRTGSYILKIPFGAISNNCIKVTVECEFKISLFSSKMMKTTVSLNI